MIFLDPTVIVPIEWTDAQIIGLYDHARDLGRHGNPAGYSFTAAVARYTSAQNQYGRFLRRYDRWDYAGLRAYIAAHPAEVAHVWRLRIRSY